MNGGVIQHSAVTDSVERACAIRKEEAQLRLARIQNGADPSQKNGHTVELVALASGGLQWHSTSGRKSPVFRGQATATSWRTSHPKWD